MNAKEMFEELEYIFIDERNHQHLPHIEYKKSYEEECLFFNIRNKELECYGDDGVMINRNLFTAIHQQMKELGWLE